LPSGRAIRPRDAPEIPAIELAALAPRALVHELCEQGPALSILGDELVEDRYLLLIEPA
jgi:hypothetical protein